MRSGSLARRPGRVLLGHLFFAQARAFLPEISCPISGSDRRTLPEAPRCGLPLSPAQGVPLTETRCGQLDLIPKMHNHVQIDRSGAPAACVRSIVSHIDCGSIRPLQSSTESDQIPACSVAHRCQRDLKPPFGFANQPLHSTPYGPHSGDRDLHAPPYTK
ncbi:hypothetical protein DAEQUDRAFT_150760 [Daedalea quercina L-15889]|uniref:Uncharacterized protein n=1 Tax=Daedalea quercina L-15889 TaxID=1314783 RepID=A0A165KLS3_9APHY|nr:hypothetical protein DAEQUDRAFT_150760 [Daedalea quercina L-15889]